MKKKFRLHARISKQENEAINIIAQLKGLNISETVRLLICDYSVRQGLEIESIVSSTICISKSLKKFEVNK